MTKPINTESIEKATHTSWADWVQKLDAAGGRNMSHPQLAQMIAEQLDGTVDSAGWWAQGITVAYERHIGARVPGQRADGLFEVAVSRTVPHARADVFAAVTKLLATQSEFNGQEPTNQRVSETPNRSNWRCDFADGSKFAASVEGSGSAKIVLSHTAIPTHTEADIWKAYWKSLLDNFAQSL